MSAIALCKKYTKDSIDKQHVNYDENLCDARIWREKPKTGGLGYDNIQCSSKKVDGCECLCKRHFKLHSEGELWTGLITEDRPNIPVHPNAGPKMWSTDKDGNDVVKEKKNKVVCPEDLTIDQLNVLMDKKKKEQLCKLESELESMKKKMEKANDELEEAQSELEEVQSDFEEVQSDLYTVKSDLETKTYEFQEAEEELYKVHHHISEYVQENYDGIEVVKSEYLKIMEDIVKEYTETYGSEIQEEYMKRVNERNKAAFWEGLRNLCG